MMSWVPVNSDTPHKKAKKKKHKQEREENGTIAGQTPDDLPQLPEAPSPVHLSTPAKEDRVKLKKKKKREREENGIIAGQTPDDLLQPPEAPSPVHPSTPAKEDRVKLKKKKKKERERLREEEQVSLVNSPIQSPQLPAILTPPDLRMREGKKKKMTTADSTHQAQQMDTTPEPKRKKRKSDAMTQPTTAPEVKESPKKKMKKRRKTDSVNKGQQVYRGAADFDSEEDQQAFKEMQEFVPNLTFCSHQKFLISVNHDLPRFREFKQQGIKFRCGRYTKKENEQIKQNVLDFLALMDISSPTLLFYPEKEQMTEIRRLRKEHNFLSRIAEGIPRMVLKIYNRARRIFSRTNYKGRFYADEINSLKKLQTLHGNNWKIISEKMDRSIYSLEKRFNQLAAKNGPWDDEEFSLLLEAVQAHLRTQAHQDGSGSPGEGRLWLDRKQLCNKLPWKNISLQVGSRSWTQCREKWFTFLKRKMVAGKPTIFSRGTQNAQAKITLINQLYDMRVQDVADIDWEEVAKSIGRVSPYYVQQVFHGMKVTQVPLWHTLPYCDIIDTLWKRERPRLERILEDAREKGLLEEEQQEVEEREEKFLFSDIFSQEEVFKEIDNTRLMPSQMQTSS